LLNTTISVTTQVKKNEEMTENEIGKVVVDYAARLHVGA